MTTAHSRSHHVLVDVDVSPFTVTPPLLTTTDAEVEEEEMVDPVLVWLDWDTCFASSNVLLLSGIGLAEDIVLRKPQCFI